ncbi:11000_t:CDS:2, partial [Paraglomus occultum]
LLKIVDVKSFPNNFIIESSTELRNKNGDLFSTDNFAIFTITEKRREERPEKSYNQECYKAGNGIASMEWRLDSIKTDVDMLNSILIVNDERQLNFTKK